MNILKHIFNGRELTICRNGGAILNKWSSERAVDLSLHTANYLINSDILILDSGNWETGEEHYVYHNDCSIESITMPKTILDELKGILRELNLNSLELFDR